MALGERDDQRLGVVVERGVVEIRAREDEATSQPLAADVVTPDPGRAELTRIGRPRARQDDRIAAVGVDLDQQVVLELPVRLPDRPIPLAVVAEAERILQKPLAPETLSRKVREMVDARSPIP